MPSARATSAWLSARALRAARIRARNTRAKIAAGSARPTMNEPGAATTSRVSKTCQYRPLVRATFRLLLPRSATGKSGR